MIWYAQSARRRTLYVQARRLHLAESSSKSINVKIVDGLGLFMTEHELKPIFCVLEIENDPETIIKRTMQRLREIAYENDLSVRLVAEWC